MNIQLSAKINGSTGSSQGGDSALVFYFGGGVKIQNHRFFKILGEEDQNYLKNFWTRGRNAVHRGSPQEEIFACLFLPSGRKILLLADKKDAGPNSRAAKRNSFRKIIIVSRRLIALARKEKIKKIVVNLNDFIPDTRYKIQDTEEIAELMAAQFELANFEFNDYKTKPKEGWNFVEDVLVVAKGSALLKKSLASGKIIGEEINKARTLANTPGGDMTPARLAEEAVKSGRNSGFAVKILKEDQIKKLGMGGIIGVSKGSAERPRFIIMEYMKGKKNEALVVLVGKGVTFDTGGLNLKPSSYIYEMHMDMSGGAAVIHTIAALARLKVKKNIVGLVPAVENMPSGSSYHPGDLLKTMNGKTIEVMDTDAEGRVILADALEYSKKYNPELVVDIATLTGAAEVALGQRASAIFSTDPKIEKEMIEAGEKTGDYLWPLPLWEDYEEEIKGTFGDFANVGKTRYGGAITGAVFLWQFIKPANGKEQMANGKNKRLAISSKQQAEIPWVHLDIAPRMTSIESDALAKGAAGASIALLTRFLREH